MAFVEYMPVLWYDTNYRWFRFKIFGRCHGRHYEAVVARRWLVVRQTFIFLSVRRTIKILEPVRLLTRHEHSRLLWRECDGIRFWRFRR